MALLLVRSEIAVFLVATIGNFIKVMPLIPIFLIAKLNHHGLIYKHTQDVVQRTHLTITFSQYIYEVFLEGNKILNDIEDTISDGVVLHGGLKSHKQSMASINPSN